MNYNEIIGLRWSTLRAGLDSGLRLRHLLDNGRADTGALGLGRAAHVATLTPHLLGTLSTLPDEHLTGSGAVSTSAKTKTFLADNAGVEWYSRADVATAQRIADAVGRHPVAAETLELCQQREVVVTAIDPDVGPVKAQLDAYSTVGMLADLKTHGGRSGPISERSVARAIQTYGYAGQLAWYRRVARLAGLSVAECRLIFVESAAPHDVIVVDMAEWEAFGDAEVDRALQVWRDVHAGRVVGVAPGLVRLPLPAWLMDYDEGDMPEVDGIDG